MKKSNKKKLFLYIYIGFTVLVWVAALSLLFYSESLMAQSKQVDEATSYSDVESGLKKKPTQ